MGKFIVNTFLKRGMAVHRLADELKIHWTNLLRFDGN